MATNLIDKVKNFELNFSLIAFFLLFAAIYLIISINLGMVWLNTTVYATIALVLSILSWKFVKKDFDIKIPLIVILLALFC